METLVASQGGVARSRPQREASLIAMRHFLAENTAVARSNRRLCATKLLAVFLPLRDYIMRARWRPSPAQMAKGSLCFHDTDSHRAALLHLKLDDAQFVRTRDRKGVLPSEVLLSDQVNLPIVFRMTAFSVVLAAAMVNRLFRRWNTRFSDHAAYYYELVVYRYTQHLLAAATHELPRAIFIADSYSTRSIAIIDFYRARGVPTNMVQHGLIQNVGRYKSHADNYFVWSDFERDKVSKKVRGYTTFSYTRAPVLRAAAHPVPGNESTLLVLNPVQGVGNPYDRMLLELISDLALAAPVSIRLHPSDDREAFSRCLCDLRIGTIAISSSTWALDLDSHSSFLVLNSTCALDVINSGKRLATLGRRKLGYPPLNVFAAGAIPDVSSLEEFVSFRHDAIDLDLYRSVLAGTLGEAYAV